MLRIYCLDLLVSRRAIGYQDCNFHQLFGRRVSDIESSISNLSNIEMTYAIINSQESATMIFIDWIIFPTSGE